MAGATLRSFTITVKFRKLDDSCPTVSPSSLNSTNSTAAHNNGLLGQPCTFKVDGQRFQTSSRTIKFHCDVKYHVHVNVNPPVQLDWLRIAGSDSPLQVSSSISASASPSTLRKPSQQDSGGKAASQYWAEWDTTGLTPTQSGKREAINFALQGPDIMLSKAIQCKFYSKCDSHAGWGNALDAIVYKCATDSLGSLVVTDEEFK